MSEIANSGNLAAFAGEESATERRIFRGMCITVVAAVVLSAGVASWRVTTGLLLGGVLSLFNHHWLRTSIAAMFDSASTTGAKPNVRVVRFLLRYFIVGASVAAAYMLDLVSLAATLFGMCSFVVAALVEAFILTYNAIVHREEN